MSIFKQEIGCCGADFKKDNISFLGLLTLSASIIIFLSILWIVTLPAYLIGFKFHNLFKIIIMANINLIKNSSILRKTKCMTAGKLLRYSPFASGLFFKFFNYVVLSFCWGLLFIAIPWWILK